MCVVVVGEKGGGGSTLFFLALPFFIFSSAFSLSKGHFPHLFLPTLTPPIPLLLALQHMPCSVAQDHPAGDPLLLPPCSLSALTSLLPRCHLARILPLPLCSRAKSAAFKHHYALFGYSFLGHDRQSLCNCSSPINVVWCLIASCAIVRQIREGQGCLPVKIFFRSQGIFIDVAIAPFIFRYCSLLLLGVKPCTKMLLGSSHFSYSSIKKRRFIQTNHL
mmetsp:Transcript_23876/g.60386  ORF Transcript_23876/g.60386 Transcript_23876/m.60386 type:complete len:219 (+) Transcript_23876:160-816(+)